jgi:DNA repair protein RecO
MHTCEALILKTVRFRAKDQVVTAFSGSRGLFSFFMKGVKTRPMLEPLMLCELVTAESRGELERLLDLTVLKRYELLRLSLSKLKAASQMASLVLKTQLPLKPAQALYTCMLAHLDWLAHGESSQHTLASFHIKLLKCEGLIKLSKACTQCNKAAKAIQKGETLCPEHLDPFSGGISIESFEALLQLYELKQFKAIESIFLPDDLLKDIRILFEELTEAHLQAKS